MFDWNGNGREDWGDRYIDYQIYNDIYNSDEKPLARIIIHQEELFEEFNL